MKILVSFRAGDNLIYRGFGRTAGETQFEQVAGAESGGVADGPAVGIHGQRVASRQDGVWVKLGQTAAERI